MSLRQNAAQTSCQQPSVPFGGRGTVATRFSSENGPRGARLTFTSGARTAWHSRPAGIALLVVDGRGELQRDGGSVERLLPGDVVWLEPGQRQWHGASARQSVTLIALDHSRPQASLPPSSSSGEDDFDVPSQAA